MSEATVPTITTIKALGRYSKKTPDESLGDATAVYTGVYGSPTDYPAPPYAETTYKGAIDLLSVRIAAARGGGLQAIAERNAQVKLVNKMTSELGHYVENACKNDMPTFLKSGFQARTRKAALPAPLSQAIRSIQAGNNSGQLYITLMAIVGAIAYEFRYAPTVNGTPASWVTQLFGKTRPGITLTGLTPGTTYSFQVRSFSDATGYSDWSDPITRIVT